MLDAHQGSGAGHVGAVRVEAPGEPRRGGLQPGPHRHVQLAGAVVEFPGEFGSQGEEVAVGGDVEAFRLDEEIV